MADTPAQRALTAATASLVVAVACLAMFLPPLLDSTLGSTLRIVAIALLLAVSALLHWVYLGIAAFRLGRSVAGWTALSVALFPVGSVAALVLLGWFYDEADVAASAT